MKKTARTVSINFTDIYVNPKTQPNAVEHSKYGLKPVTIYMENSFILIQYIGLFIFRIIWWCGVNMSAFLKKGFKYIFKVINL